MTQWTLEGLRTRRSAILAIARRRGAKNLRVFGSVARGTNQSTSDVDFLVELEPGRSLIDLGGLLIDLEDLLDCKVDIVSERGLRPRFAQRVRSEAKPL
jgi:predicted nucleotidyltransferase